MSFSPDGALVAGTADGVQLTVWDATTGELRYGLEGAAGDVSFVVFSVEGSLVAVAGPNGTTTLRDLES